jgi:Zn-dependent protease with chaperone function
MTGDASTADSPPATSGLPRLPPDPRLPGQRRALAYAAGALALCIVVTGADLAGPSPGAAILPLAAVAGCCLGLPARRLRMRRLLAARQYRALAGDPAAAALEAALRPGGIRTVRLLAGDRVRGLARNFRCGPTAVVLVLEALLRRPDIAEFFLAHEAAHIARRDTVLRPLLATVLLACWLSAAFSWPLAFLALPLIIAAGAAGNRAMELDCDRLAARWVGADAARRALQVLLTIREQSKPSPARKLRSLLTYPATERRIAATAGAAPGRQPGSGTA